MLGKTRAELVNSMSSAELSEWIAYYHTAPFGPFRDGLEMGKIAAAIHNTAPTKKKRKKAAKATDFLLSFDVAQRSARKAEQTSNKIIAMFERIGRTMKK